MGKRKSIIGLGAALGAVAGVAGAFYLRRRALPQTSGTIRLEGLLHGVEVIRDRWGVPHIYATHPRDLFFAQGFVHAQDRFFQMEFWRRLVTGRLSEVLGRSALEADRWLRVLGLHRVAEKEVALLDTETRELMLAYVSGINAFIDRDRLPLEFSLLRYRPERWKIADSLTWIKFIDWTLAVNWTSELLRAQLVARFGPERVALLEAPYSQDHPITLPAGLDFTQVDIGNEALARAAAVWPYTGPPAESGLGSNGWVVDGSHTASGAPLLANDMHLSLDIPSIWYESHLCGGDYDVVGLSFPGLPGIVVGHNGHVAWGFTAGFCDTQDLYIERLNPQSPHQYEFKGRWRDAELFKEEIVVKGESSVVEQVMVTHHGPLIDGLLGHLQGEETQPLALRWPALEPNDMAGTIFEVARVKNCADFHERMRRWVGPALNVVYADVEGNIGYTLVGRVPQRTAGHDGRLPVPGWTGEYEWRGYVPFQALPHVINPSDGMLITANAKPVREDYPYFLGHSWMPGLRAARIKELLTQKPTLSPQGLTVTDFRRMQFDQTSVLARRVGRHLSRLASQVPGLDPGLFRDWEGELASDSPAAAVYEVFVRRMLYNLFEGVLESWGAEPQNQDERALMVDYLVGKGLPLDLPTIDSFGYNGRALLEQLVDRPDHPLFEHRARDAVMLSSLREAVAFWRWKLGSDASAWRWGDLHSLVFTHPLGQIGPLNRLFNRGPYPIGGDETTVWAATRSYHALDKQGGMVGPVCRFVVDLNDLRRSCALNAPGQSGRLASQHYADRITAWFEGDYHPMLYDRTDIEREAKETLRLVCDDMA